MKHNLGRGKPVFNRKNEDTVNHSTLMHTMHEMNTSNRFCNKQEALSTPLQVGIRKLPEKPGRFGVLDIVQDQ